MSNAKNKESRSQQDHKKKRKVIGKQRIEDNSEDFIWHCILPNRLFLSPSVHNKESISYVVACLLNINLPQIK